MITRKIIASFLLAAALLLFSGVADAVTSKMCTVLCSPPCIQTQLGCLSSQLGNVAP